MKSVDIFKVGVNWQVVIPPKIREYLEIERGDYVRFVILENGDVTIRKVVLQEVKNFLGRRSQ